LTQKVSEPILYIAGLPETACRQRLDRIPRRGSPERIDARVSFSPIYISFATYFATHAARENQL
jgi:hypothetical protein